MQDGGLLPTLPEGDAGADAGTPPPLGDYVQVTTGLLDPSDTYWTTAAGSTATGASLYTRCYTVFGTADVTPLDPRRDLLITEAYNDHLDVVPRPLPSGAVGAADDATVRTMQLFADCFPSKNTYAIRGGAQWIVWGDQTGFLHHVVPRDPTGECRNACDPVFQRKSGRVLEVPAGTDIQHMTAQQAALFEFTNPMFRFGIVQGGGLPAACGTPAGSMQELRDMQFRFASTGSFVPMLMNLSFDNNTQVSPVAMSYVAATKELAVTDGTLNGLIFVSLATAAWSRSFY
jgi:hypothetical protein